MVVAKVVRLQNVSQKPVHFIYNDPMGLTSAMEIELAPGQNLKIELALPWKGFGAMILKEKGDRNRLCDDDGPSRTCYIAVGPIDGDNDNDYVQFSDGSHELFGQYHVGPRGLFVVIQQEVLLCISIHDTNWQNCLSASLAARVRAIMDDPELVDANSFCQQFVVPGHEKAGLGFTPPRKNFKSINDIACAKSPPRFPQDQRMSTTPGKENVVPPVKSQAVVTTEKASVRATAKGSAPPLPPKAKGIPPKGRAPVGPVPKSIPKAGLQGRRTTVDLSGKTTAASSSTALEETPFMRRLYWKALDLTDQNGTIFEDSGKARARSCHPRFDKDALGRMLEGEKERTLEARQRSTRALSAVRKQAEGSKVFDDKRAMNIAIVLKRLPVSNEEMVEILLKLLWEDPQLSADFLDGSLEVMPSGKEAEKLLEFKERITSLRDVEQAVLPFASLKRGTARCRIMSFARQVQSRMDEMQRFLRDIRASCKSIRDSELLREVLLLALDLGNYINHGDSSKGAKAIAFGSLLQLKDFKAGKVSSLHFLCASLYHSDKARNAAVLLAQELGPVTRAKDLQLQTLAMHVRNFQRDADVVTAETAGHSQEYLSEEGDEPQSADMGEFLEDPMQIRGSARERLFRLQRVVQKLIDQLKEDLQETADQTKATLRYCGINRTWKGPQDIPEDIEPLLGQLAQFIGVFAKHWEEVMSNLHSYSRFFADHPASLPKDCSSPSRNLEKEGVEFERSMPSQDLTNAIRDLSNEEKPKVVSSASLDPLAAMRRNRTQSQTSTQIENELD